jgi:hypothetical protein
MDPQRDYAPHIRGRMCQSIFFLLSSQVAEASNLTMHAPNPSCLCPVKLHVRASDELSTGVNLICLDSNAMGVLLVVQALLVEGAHDTGRKWNEGGFQAVEQLYKIKADADVLMEPRLMRAHMSIRDTSIGGRKWPVTRDRKAEDGTLTTPDGYRADTNRARGPSQALSERWRRLRRVRGYHCVNTIL